MARQLDGDGIGIVAFAGSAFLVCPLTIDYGAFHQSLDAIDVHTIPRGGTNIPSAILAARAALGRRPGSDRILILVTDGENLEGDALAAAKDAAQQDGLKIYTVGVGTAEGDLIPLPSDQGGGFVKDEKGALVKSHLDEAGLKAIAAATAGTYVHLGAQSGEFEAFLRTVFGSVTKRDLIYRQQRIYNQRYQWPLAASLTMLLASLVVGTRRSRRRAHSAVARGRGVRRDGSDRGLAQSNAIRECGSGNRPRHIARRPGACAGIQRGYECVSSGTVFPGLAVLRAIDQDCTGERRKAPGRPGGRLLQPGQFSLSSGPAV